MRQIDVKIRQVYYWESDARLKIVATTELGINSYATPRAIVIETYDSPLHGDHQIGFEGEWYWDVFRHESEHEYESSCSCYWSGHPLYCRCK